MSQPPGEAGPGSANPRESLRLTFRFTRKSIELVAQERLGMITPPAVGEPPQEGVNGGTWLELRDSKDHRIAAQVLNDPFQTEIDHHSPDGRIEHFHREIGEGQFDVLVPAVRGATSVSVLTNELGGTDARQGAVEVARFELERPAR